MIQLDMLDYLDTVTGSGRAVVLDWERRRASGRLAPGEPCPACSTPVPARRDASGLHAIVAADPLTCQGMAAARRRWCWAVTDHGDARPEDLDEATTDAVSWWGADTVAAWAADPRTVLDALDFPRSGIVLRRTAPDGTVVDEPYPCRSIASRCVQPALATLIGFPAARSAIDHEDAYVLAGGATITRAGHVWAVIDTTKETTS